MVLLWPAILRDVYNIGPFPTVCLEVKFLLKAIGIVAVYANKKYDKGENFKQRKLISGFHCNLGKKVDGEKCFRVTGFPSTTDTGNALFMCLVPKWSCEALPVGEKPA